MTFQTPLPAEKVLEEIHKRTYVLPAIQREFIWSTDQIRMLFDSLLRGYPIGSFLFWKVKPEQTSDFVFYEFLLHYHEKNSPYAMPTSIPPGQSVIAILDGQQRLTSLNIGLYGSHAERQPKKWASNPNAYPKRRLYLNLLGEGPEEELGMQYDFRFLTDAEASSQEGQADRWFRIGNILEIDAANSGPAIMAELARRRLQDEKPFQILWSLFRAIREAPSINYYLEESQDPNKVLDIFVRVNSAGTTLSYSDLLLSMATNQWKELDAREEVRSLLSTLNDGQPPFSFSKDLVLKAGLMLVDAPDIRFKVSNFTQANMSSMEKRWQEIRSALIIAADLLRSFGFQERTLTADSVLIPISFYAHHRGLESSYVISSAAASDRAKMRSWVMRSLMKRGIWGSGLDTLLLRLRDVIRTEGITQFPSDGLEVAMAGLGKSLEFTDAEISELSELRYGSPRTFAVLAMLYPGLDLTKSFHEDHIFPRSRFTRARLTKTGIAEEKIDDYLERVNSLPNLQLLSGLPNIEKQAKLPGEWVAGPHFPSEAARRTYLTENDLGELPLTLEGFLEFYEGRRKRIEGRLRSLLGVAVVEPGHDEEDDGDEAVEIVEIEEGEEESFFEEREAEGEPGVPADVADFLKSRVRSPETRASIQRFLQQVLSWPDVRADVGESTKTPDGYSWAIRLRRRRVSGSFVKVLRSGRVRFRLEHSDARGIEPVDLRELNPRNPYKVYSWLDDERGLEACLELGRRAYEKSILTRRSRD
jgi:Protein of unknown function DUF262